MEFDTIGKVNRTRTRDSDNDVAVGKRTIADRPANATVRRCARTLRCSIMLFPF